jgi:hypothetical protein
VFAKFMQDVLVENFPGDMVNSLAKEFFMVNFLRDDVYDDDGVLQVGPLHTSKIFENLNF